MLVIKACVLACCLVLAATKYHRDWASFETSNYEVNIDLQQILSTTEEEYLSFCLDPYLKHDTSVPWQTLNFSNPRVHTLAKGLAPSILRFGGTDADWSVFYNVTSLSGQQMIWKLIPHMVQDNAFIVPFFPQDIDNLYSIAASAGGRLLFDLNIQQRLGEQWDPTNAFLLMRYIEERGYAQSMDFELGNEPNYPKLTIDGKRIAQDFLILKNLLSQMTVYQSSRIVGPDIGAGVNQIATDFAATIGKNITALTMHYYYFKGPGAKLQEFYDVTHFDRFEVVATEWRDAVRKASGANVDVWVGETSDSFDYGTPNVTNRYISGFLWLDKLGISARNEYKMVLRQDFYGGNYPLLTKELYPTPDYWLSHVFKRLVGKEVLKVGINSTSNSGQKFRVYGHCTSTRAKYPKGSVTLYMVNINSDQVTFQIDASKYGQVADAYLMTPENNDLLSTYLLLNGVRLEMVDDMTLPDLKPMEVSLSQPLNAPGLSYGFLVLKDAQAKICNT